MFVISVGFCQDKTYTKKQLDALAKEEDQSFEIIDNVPVYKGCEKVVGNTGKKKCMSQKVAEHFVKYLDMTVLERSGLSPGLKKILVQFKINTEGKVVAIEAKAPHVYLEQEAIRVAKLIPDLKPGFQNGKPVIVPYTLPLKFSIEAPENETLRYPRFRGCDEELSNEELKKCSVKKIKDFIKLRFDYDIADRALPLEKSTKFQLDFVINKSGKIEQVNAKANHRAIAIEAIRVAKQLPKFKRPGMEADKSVDVPFSLLMTIYF